MKTIIVFPFEVAISIRPGELEGRGHPHHLFKAASEDAAAPPRARGGGGESW